ncbi:hypothetical protein ACFY2J_39510 [Streptomyces collinus]|uniref:hypothetical protein n=1 Tax=Streptomyces collinus TaxID=42684 RepID=UPI0036B73ADD
MLRPQRILPGIQSVEYWQRQPVAGGSQLVGSWSALERLEAVETALSARLSAIQSVTY